ncbi:inositol monophosphatase [Sphingomonas sp. NSE70-1]|uniref:Inositol monophosphatase n=1 Tax=Sphingomonas caseinilyticus TaxID=2908205 RepID=A0ABT0RQM0_9SPHN|nr:inositol monophosphatase family protein [Sphingomonas caseinilyticus]MCL6697312.1 inositol monophosphatase [Sphingomonas caseinilyticus]
MAVTTMEIPAPFHAAVEEIMARAADRAIMPRLGKLLAEDKHEKAIGELVTIADRESEQILAEGLLRLLPEASIVGEEAADADPAIMAKIGGRLCWIIDPLDGTSNFARGEGPFGILVALAERGQPIGGWIYDPRSRRFCAAARNSGAFINGERTWVPPATRASPLVAISSLVSRMPDGDQMIERFSGSFATIPIPRCAAAQYPSMVLGENDIALFGRTLPWDHAAGVLFLAEAGGIATRLDGSPYRVDDGRPGLVAAGSERLWAKAMAILEDVGT